MLDLTSQEFAQRSFEFNLLDERQLETLWSEFGTHDVPIDEFRATLVRRGLMTNFQVDRILKGERTGYFYGDYKVLYIVGAGSFARVFRAVHCKTGKVVAVKALRRRFADMQTTKDQFVREGKMGEALRHPNIVPIYEVHSDGPRSFLVMDFVEGQSLRDFVKIRKKIEPVEATRLITDVVSGLAYAASKGVTHRDLKMSNVLVSSTGRAMLADFGLAAVSGKLTDDMIMNCPNPRTIDYAALERATGVRKDDARSDIYFVGCIFYHMLTGKPPLYESKDRVQRLSIQRFQEIQPILQLEPMLPPAVALVVSKAMELNPSKRYTTPQEMLTDLKVLARRLSDPNDGAAPVDGQSTEFSLNQSGGNWTTKAEGQTIMVVETNAELQNALRDGLKKNGFRVLVLSDPARALERFVDSPQVADAVLFSAVQIGESAIAAYRQFCNGAVTKHVPALLLLNEKQQLAKGDAPPGDCRAVLSMPVKLGALRAELKRVLDAANPQQQSAAS